MPDEDAELRALARQYVADIEALLRRPGVCGSDDELQATTADIVQAMLDGFANAADDIAMDDAARFGTLPPPWVPQGGEV